MTVFASSLLLLVWCALRLAAADPDPLPTFEQRRDEFLRRTFSSERLLFMAIDTSIDQALGQPCEWGRRAPSFGIRYADRLGRRMTRNGIEFLTAAALGEDPRLRPSGETNLLRRFRHVLLQSVGSSNGARPFLVSRFAGTLAGNAATTAWRNDGMTVGRIGDRVAWTYVTHLQDSFVTEFGPGLKSFGRRTMLRALRWTRRSGMEVAAAAPAP